MLLLWSILSLFQFYREIPTGKLSLSPVSKMTVNTGRDKDPAAKLFSQLNRISHYYSTPDNGIPTSPPNGQSSFATWINIPVDNDLALPTELYNFVHSIRKDPKSFNSFVDQGAKFEFPTFGKCELTKEPIVYPLRSVSLSSYFTGLFELIQSSSAFGTKLSRFDLFHGHLFSRNGTVGIVFHSEEYPSFDAHTFPVSLGFCQDGSDLQYSEEKMEKRNYIWTVETSSNSTSLFNIDALKANQMKLLSQPIPDTVFTLYEDTLGTVIADVYFLPNQTTCSWSSYF
jgi:hypothetical protein